MTQDQLYRLTFTETKDVFTGMPADPNATPWPRPDIPMPCTAGYFYHKHGESIWYECKLSGNYTEMESPFFEIVTNEIEDLDLGV